jgi:hypothetical protein
LGSTCNQLLDLCLRGEPWSRALLESCIREEDGRTLVSVVVERLADLFEPRLARVYERLFGEVIQIAAPELAPRVRGGAVEVRAAETVDRVYVLSRITLGADIAVTSVLMDAARRRYPGAEIAFVGPAKNFELFAGERRAGGLHPISHVAVPYARGGALVERLRASGGLWFEDGIVIDPDSRLTQLGLIRVCPEDRYFHFDSRSYGGDDDDRLPELAARWARDVFGVEGARPFIAPRAEAMPQAEITVSLGVGENLAKRLDDDFELGLMRLLVETGRTVLVDKGGSAEEKARVEAVLQPGMLTHDGAFAPFAAAIARSSVFIGYDSAAGHAASACGVPVISVANGFVSERAFQRWRPIGTIVRGANSLDQVREALRGLSLL